MISRQIARRRKPAPVAAAILFMGGLAAVGGVRLSAQEAAATAPGEAVQQWFAISEVILRRHVDPPTRQELLKAAVQAVYAVAKQETPRGLARRLSEESSPEGLSRLLQEQLDRALEDHGLSAEAARRAGIEGILRRAVGRRFFAAEMAGGAIPSLIPLSEFYVQQQLRDNQYVGIGIQLSVKDSYPVMNKAFPRGPAWNAGGRDGDLMVSIDGIDAKDMPLTRVVKLLRGQAGKPTTVVVRRPNEKETRTLNMVRGVVPFDTVLGVERDDQQDWRYTSKVDPRIAYLKFESLRGSTPAELRRVASQVRAAGCRAVILDFRRTQAGELRHAVMVADLLLGAGPLGHVLDADRQRAFASAAEQLFAGWPMAVLIDPSTAGQAEWIAAALQDNQRAVLVGQPTAGQGALVELVELPMGLGGMRLNTGSLYRANGEPLSRPMPAAATMLMQQAGARNGIAGRGFPARFRGLVPDRQVAATKAMGEAVRQLQETLGAPPPAQDPGPVPAAVEEAAAPAAGDS